MEAKRQNKKIKNTEKKLEKRKKVKKKNIIIIIMNQKPAGLCKPFYSQSVGFL